MNGGDQKRKKKTIPAMKTSPRLQKISTGLSLVTLALGFSLMGLVSVNHQVSSGDDLSTAICALGGWAGVAAGSVFFVTAFFYCRRSSWLAA
jgi:hypothetical protein